MSHLQDYLQTMNTTVLEDMMQTMSANAYAKDKQGRLISANAIFPKLFSNSQMVKLDDFIGKSSFDYQPYHEAKFVIENDQAVMKKESPLVVVEGGRIFDGSIHNFLSHKIPLRNKMNKVIGVFGISFQLGQKNLVELDNTQFVESETNLSKRQMECLYYLVKGMTMCQIGKQLKLSPKTIEHYLNLVKDKLKCKTRAELINKGLQFSVIRNKL